MFDYNQQALDLSQHVVSTEHVTPNGIVFQSQYLTVGTAQWYEHELSQAGNAFGFDHDEGVRIAHRVIGMAQATLERINAASRRKAFDDDRKLVVGRYQRGLTSATPTTL